MRRPGPATTLAALALLLLTAACDEPAADGPPLIVFQPDLAAPDAAPPEDALPPDMLLAPARVLIERPPLPFAPDNRLLNPTFDPFANGTWIIDPIDRASRIFDHRLPFAGPALAIDGTADPPFALGLIHLDATPLVATLWIGIEPVDGVPHDMLHVSRAFAQLWTFSPTREPTDDRIYRLRPIDTPVVGEDGLVWRPYAGRIDDPTLGFGWLYAYRDLPGRLAIGAPAVHAAPADPAAFTLDRIPRLTAEAPDPAHRPRLPAERPTVPRRERPRLRLGERP